VLVMDVGWEGYEDVPQVCFLPNPGAGEG